MVMANAGLLERAVGCLRLASRLPCSYPEDI